MTNLMTALVMVSTLIVVGHTFRGDVEAAIEPKGKCPTPYYIEMDPKTTCLMVHMTDGTASKFCPSKEGV
ncbi:MAG: hypothetical protein GY778_28785 [bacterium]|nr:hypothetical protein [bacterium]